MAHFTNDDRLRVRLVPKPNDDAVGHRPHSGMTPQLAKRSSPSPGRAEEAVRIASGLGIDAAVSKGHAVEGTLPAASLRTLFQVNLRPKSDDRTTGYFGQGTQEYVVPDAELVVPEPLRSTIDFAYIPTPPRYYSPTLVPPNTSNYHLRIEDVVRVVRAESCHRRGWTGRNIRVAMADTGFARHPFFDQYGFHIHRVHTASTQHPAVDDSGHGTGECVNVLAVAPDCMFFGVKHNDYSAEALETSLDQSPRILTNSWGWNVDHTSKQALRESDPNLFNEILDIERILLTAIDDGVIVVFSAGNGHRPFPACLPGAISVGGVTVHADGSLKASNYSSSFRSQFYPGRNVPDICGVVGERGNSLLEGHIMLPVPHGSKLEGENISRASDRNKGWGVFSGTSAAAPQVAGVIALMLCVNPELKQEDVRAILSDSATDVTDGASAMGDPADVGVDFATGPGLVNAFEACLRAEQLVVPP